MEEVKSKSEPLSHILAYYRERVDEIQKEREDWFERLESLRISQESFHKQEWELKHRAEEIAELQKALSDSHVALFEERELALRLKREVEELRGRAVEDRRKIMELLALTGSVEQDITYFKDCRPEKIQKHPLVASKENPDKTKSKKATGKPQLQAQRQPRQILRTIVLPNEQINTLQVEVENLRKINEEQKALYEQEIVGLKEDRRAREEEMRLKYVDPKIVQEKLEEMQKRVQKNEGLNYAITKDYLNEKHKSQTDARQVQEENELLRLENDQMRKAMKNLTFKAQQDVKLADVEREKKTNETQVQEENLQIIKEQYMRIQQIYLTKIRTLEESLEKERKRNKEIEQRRKMEVEGFHRDIEGVKRKTRIYDEYLHRVKRLIDQKPKEVIEMAERGEESGLDVAPLKEQVAKLETELEQIKARHLEPVEPEKEVDEE